MFELFLENLLVEASTKPNRAAFMAPIILKWLKLNPATELEAFCANEPDDDADAVLCER